MARLDGKIAMITGAGGEHGLGRAIARRFADEGADLVLVDVAPTGLRVGATPARGWRAIAELGRIDVLVNNAGAPGSLDRTLVVDLAENAWDTVLDTNLKGTFLCSQAVARTMLERGGRGRIISMSSQWGKKGRRAPRGLLRVEVRDHRLHAVTRP